MDPRAGFRDKFVVILSWELWKGEGVKDRERAIEHTHPGVFV